MSHTKGPWKFRKAVNYEGFSIHPVNTVLSLAACERFGTNMTINCFNFPGETEANARLIAAAPELLEACETALTNLSPLYSSDHLVIKRLRVAIAKAKGEW